MTVPARPLRMGLLFLEIESKGESGRDSGPEYLGTHLFKIQHAILTSAKKPGNHDS